MQTIRRSPARLTAAALFASAFAASPALSQPCIWNYHALPPGLGFSPVVVYHAGLERVLVLQTSAIGLTATRIWAWDGVTWMLLDSSGPSPRTGAAAAYDSARDRLVFFGGREDAIGSASYPFETWEWDGAAWTHSIASSPVGRQWHRMAYDEARERTILFGGTSQGTGRLGDTWEWDGVAWMYRTETGPSPRLSPALAYDSIRMRTVLYGGRDGTLMGPADLWEWDGVQWSQVPSNIPGPGSLWMVFDPARDRMVIGRQTASGTTTGRFETWELDPESAAWSLRDPGISPRGPGAFDILRGRPVLLGGGGFTMEFHSDGTAISPYITQHPVGGSFPLGATVVLSVDASGAAPLSYQWRRNGEPLADGGNIFGATTRMLTIDPMRREDAGEYDVIVSNHCASASSTVVQVQETWTGTCYANCDNSSIEPILNVDDFVCFINAFAHATTLPYQQQASHYANCDRGYVAPTLNVDDFICFMNEFAAGCR